MGIDKSLKEQLHSSAEESPAGETVMQGETFRTPDATPDRAAEEPAEDTPAQETEVPGEENEPAEEDELEEKIDREFEIEYNKKISEIQHDVEDIKEQAVEKMASLEALITNFEETTHKQLPKLHKQNERYRNKMDRLFHNLGRKIERERTLDDDGNQIKQKDFQKAFATNTASFATGLNFYKLFWVFFIGCVIGVIVEMLFCLVTNGYLESRQGVIYGPFNPVYGFGAVCITIILYWFRKKSDIWIFVGGAVIGGAFEWFCSYFQEVFFGTVSWDYSDVMFNIGGRTCLTYCIFWGVLAMVWLKYLYPAMSKLIERIPNKLGLILSWVLVVFMALNMGVSSYAVYRMNNRHQGVQATTSIDRFVDRVYDDELMTWVYPNMRDPQTGKMLKDIDFDQLYKDLQEEINEN